jgi:PrtD family type I secretion system ABC transporter
MKDVLRQIRKHFTYSALFSFFINILYLTFPIYMLAIYDRVLASYSMPTLITITVGALFALIIFGVLNLLRSRLLLQAGNWLENSLNDRVLSDMISDASRIKQIGYKQGLVDLNTLRGYLAGPAFTTLFDIPWTPFFLLLIYLMHPILGMVATTGGVLIIILGVLQEMFTRKQINQANSINAAGRQFVAAGLRNAEVINSLGMTDNIATHWNEKQEQVMQLQTRASMTAGILQSITKSLRMSMQVLIYGFGAWLTLKNESTAGIMISASIIMGRALAPIEQGMASWKQTIEARAAYKRLSALTQIPQDAKITDLPAPKGKLDVEGATLVLGGRTVLQNISFSLVPGEALGLIGPSAAGKTSLCRMLLGIWPSMGGKVRLDGANVFQWSQEDLGKYLGYLPQDIELFPGTVSENIARMGEVDSEKIIAAAKEAGVHEMILKLPQGYDTPIGEAGTVLSGGQRQRIALARAIYGKPVFVVLDEPNSNLDDMGEKALVETLSRMKTKRITTIIVTHKPSLLAHVDKVLILKNGQVAAYGPREDVFKQLMGPVSP